MAYKTIIRGLSLFGQPHFSTHPHLLSSSNYVNVEISKSEFNQRREKLAELLLQNSEKNRNHLLILSGSQKKYMIDKIPYFFRQDTNFRYFTGCLEPDCLLALKFTHNSLNSTLFVRDSNAQEERWEGPRTSSESASEFFGVDAALPISQFERFLETFPPRTSVLHYDYNNGLNLNPSLHQLLLTFVAENKIELISPELTMQELRLIKSSSEILLMRKSAEIASQALNFAISSKGLETESQVAATIEYRVKMSGANHFAYPPVVASGNHANTIHYISNTGQRLPGDCLLVDAGCEYHGYSSDISRTWPNSGVFSPSQRILYEIILRTQSELIAELSDKKVQSLDELYNSMLRILSVYIRSELLSKSSATDLCPHHVSHYLGMDVHDTPLISRSRHLKPGMILTLEPGLYIRHDSELDDSFKGNGIRIEDDILITESGIEILSKSCVKTLSELESPLLVV